MENEKAIRWHWIRFMYVGAIIMPGPWGLATIFWPEITYSLFKFPTQDPFLYGITGSLWVTFAVLAILGLRSPLKYLPVLMFQLTYKVIWLSFVVFPLWIQGELSIYEIVFAVSMMAYVAGDLIAIPFSYVFAKESTQPVRAMG